jgi:hypothetical protein
MTATSDGVPSADRCGRVAWRAMNEELRAIHEADQADRMGGTMSPEVAERDAERLRRVAELVDAGEARTGEDCYHAAMVFQHGAQLADYRRAHELALRAAELGHRPGRWLAAAAYDRWLMRQDRLQKYGTQYRAGEAGWELYPVDPETTDDERAAWDVPTLARARQQAEELTAARPPAAGGLETLASHRAGELEVRVCRLPAAAPGWSPALEPLQTGDPVPWLPAGLTAGRLGAAFGAADAAGEVAVAWLRAPMPAIVGWRDEDGPVPEPETIEVDGRPAMVCGSFDRWTLLVVARPGAEPWTVSARCPRDELLRIAASLP